MLRVAAHDTSTAERYLAVIGMTADPRALLGPRVAARVVRLLLAGVGRCPVSRGAMSPEALAAAGAIPAYSTEPAAAATMIT